VMVASLLLLRSLADSRSEDELGRASAVLAELGTGSLQPYRLFPPASAVADEGGEAALAFARVGRTAVALGDPSGQWHAAWRAFDEWTADARQSDWRPVVYQASQEARDRLAAAGWHGVLVGMEAVVDPTAFRLGSPKVANVRHTVTRSRKGGVEVTWSPRGLRSVPERLALRDGMSAVDEVWRRTAGPALGFTVGRFEPDRMEDAAIAAARGADGTVLAFVVLRPTGSDGGWMLDLIRRLPGSVPGAVEACLVAAIEGLGAQGVHQLSLGLAPLHGLDPSVGPAAQRLLAGGARLVEPFYDYPGLAFFKRKFDPQWLPRYMVVPSRADFLPASLALLRLHVGGSWMGILLSIGGSLRPKRDGSSGPGARHTVPRKLVPAPVNGLGKHELAPPERNAALGHGQDEEP
jgi:phosphatidylglycerol lysyltransferase